MRSKAVVVALAALVTSAAARAGDVTGTVVYRGTPPAARPPVEVTKDRATCGESAPDESLAVADGRLAHVVVTVRGAPAPPPARGTLDQQRCRYVPHVQALPVGSTLELVNGDPVLHSVHGWAGKATRFDVVTPEQGARVPTRLDRPGVIQVRCDVHAWMSAYVVVVDAPAAVSVADGTFTLRALPAGTYTVTAWHERLGERTATVTVPAEGQARLELVYE